MRAELPPNAKPISALPNSITVQWYPNAINSHPIVFGIESNMMRAFLPNLSVRKETEKEPMIAEKNRQELKIGKVESSSNPITLTSFSMGDGYPRPNPLTKEPRLPAIEAIRTGNILACCFADLTTFLSIFDYGCMSY